ncbi:hypothetical protein Acr_18g0007020 [Actinidia rufa]|uniref:Aminotransferase-like plant mobile domain-containing protein n=1 Tax=Actinidia rufa TaxID=165716 RepID=A0A7J0G739_9ERIC|nr:hypothetical protein Acr_18g0007020 [Actinidia rufa]
MDPGPANHSLLTLQGVHHSSDVWRREVQGPSEFVVIKVCRVEAILKQTIRLHARVLRWRLETHAFYMTTREATITLQDVEVITRLLVDEPVTSLSLLLLVQTHPRPIYTSVWPPVERVTSGRISHPWLRDTFAGFDDAVVDCYARACIMLLMGAAIFSNRRTHAVGAGVGMAEIPSHCSAAPGGLSSAAWPSYEALAFPASCHARAHIRGTISPLICFTIVEGYHADRVTSLDADGTTRQLATMYEWMLSNIQRLHMGGPHDVVQIQQLFQLEAVVLGEAEAAGAVNPSQGDLPDEEADDVAEREHAAGEVNDAA